MSSGTILALIPDVMFGVRVRDVLGQLGYSASVVDDSPAARQQLSPELCLVIIDLRSDPAGWQELIGAAKELDPGLPILAFGSHVEAKRLQAARLAGCDRVVANSAFSANLAELVQDTARANCPDPAGD